MPALIEIQDVHKVYDMGDDKVRALDGVSMVIHEGEYVAIMGPSGSGKSTLMNLIGCLDTPTSGSYKLKGTEVAGMTDDELAAIRNGEIGFIFQTFNLIPVLSALENVEFPLLFRGGKHGGRARAMEALESVGLRDFATHRPDELSGGQRQRVAVARALVTDPSLVLADEPTANLDSRTGETIIDLMLDINRRAGTTFIFSTHDPKVMAHAQRVVRLADGRVVDAT